jgi:IMP dehydrogenase
MQIRELLAAQPRELPFLCPDSTVAHAMDLMSDKGVTGVLIGSDARTLGIFTSRDLLRCRRNFPNRAMLEIRVDEVMTQKLVVAEPRETVEQAMAMMIRAGIRHLPVVEDRRITSLLGLEDLVRNHVTALTQEMHYLKDYISDLQDAAHD